MLHCSSSNMNAVTPCENALWEPWSRCYTLKLLAGTYERGRRERSCSLWVSACRSKPVQERMADLFFRSLHDWLAQRCVTSRARDVLQADIVPKKSNERPHYKRHEARKPTEVHWPQSTIRKTLQSKSHSQKLQYSPSCMIPEGSICFFHHHLFHSNVTKT